MRIIFKQKVDIATKILSFKKMNLLEYFVLVMKFSEFSLISPHLRAYVVDVVAIVLSM